MNNLFVRAGVILLLFANSAALLAQTKAQTPIKLQQPSAQIGGVYGCAKMPPFIANLGLQQPVAIDTTLSRLPGLALRELQGQKRIYQGRTWRQTGYVSSTVRDASGHIYVIPVPSISLDINPLDKRNTIYKIDAKTGLMSVFLELPLPAQATQANPFGTMGLALDCQTNSLYVSSVAGSTPADVNGVIYQIDLSRAAVVDKLEGVDSIGLGIFNTGKQKRLYYGDARSSSVYSVPLLNKGRFSDLAEPRHEISLLALRNGDSTQVRKIKFQPSREHGYVMALSDTEFSYRLVAETSRRYRHYRFAWQGDTNSWKLLNIE